MTGFSSSRDELVSSLRAYTSLLAARNEALSRVCTTSAEIRSKLNNATHSDIAEELSRRDRDIAQFSAMCCDTVEYDSLAETAITAADSPNDELGQLAQSVISLQEDSRVLAERVLTCQSECEALLKSRLDATSKAIKQSTQRRKLDAAYGPAIRHDTPTFMDRQR